jgi:hypothetical protein
VHRIRQFISTHPIACVCDNDRCLISQWTDRSPESSLKSQEWILHVGRDENFAEEARIIDWGWFSANFDAREDEHPSHDWYPLPTP